jgi:hypothetical protein
MMACLPGWWGWAPFRSVFAGVEVELRVGPTDHGARRAGGCQLCGNFFIGSRFYITP